VARGGRPSLLVEAIAGRTLAERSLRPAPRESTTFWAKARRPLLPVAAGAKRPRPLGSTLCALAKPSIARGPNCALFFFVALPPRLPFFARLVLRFPFRPIEMRTERSGSAQFKIPRILIPPSLPISPGFNQQTFVKFMAANFCLLVKFRTNAQRKSY
jgi:hypothetical protein